MFIYLLFFHFSICCYEEIGGLQKDEFCSIMEKDDEEANQMVGNQYNFEDTGKGSCKLLTVVTELTHFLNQLCIF